MAPHYTYKKPGKERKEESYIHYYVCASDQRGRIILRKNPTVWVGANYEDGESNRDHFGLGVV